MSLVSVISHYSLYLFPFQQIKLCFEVKSRLRESAFWVLSCLHYTADSWRDGCMPQHLNSIRAVCVVLFLWVSIILYSRLVQRILIPRCDAGAIFSNVTCILPSHTRCRWCTGRGNNGHGELKVPFLEGDKIYIKRVEESRWDRSQVYQPGDDSAWFFFLSVSLTDWVWY